MRTQHRFDSGFSGDTGFVADLTYLEKENTRIGKGGGGRERPTMRYGQVLGRRGIQPHATSVLGAWWDPGVSSGVGVLTPPSTQSLGVTIPRSRVRVGRSTTHVWGKQTNHQ